MAKNPTSIPAEVAAYGKDGRRLPRRRRSSEPTASRTASLLQGVSLRTFGLVCGLASISLLGCQTGRSWEQGCPGVYSGVRYYWDQVGDLPVDGKLFFTLDLPVTVVADTILLPVSVFMKPKRPKYGFSSGCTWAEKR